MSYEGFVRQIVETYSLAPRLAERIIRIADRRIAELSINSQGDVYRYVDYLVGKFNPRREDRLTSSLDTSKRDYARTLQQKIGVEDSNLVIYTQRAYQQQEPHNPNSPTEPISPAEVLNILRGNLSELDFNILLQMMNMGANVFNFPPEELLLSKETMVSKIAQIQERLETLAQTYGRDGRLAIPPRPIVYVHFHPKLYIRFASRQYNGNPLTFFEANSSAYEGMGRLELSKFDHGLYRALVKAGQIHLAIPQNNQGISNILSTEETKKVVDAWGDSGGAIKKAAKLTGHSRQSVRRIWMEHGLKVWGRWGNGR